MKTKLAVLALSSCLFSVVASAEPLMDPTPAPVASPAPAPSPAAAAPAGSATVLLKDGSVLRGDVVSSSDGIVVFRTSGGTLSLRQETISRVDFDSAGAAPAPLVAATPSPFAMPQSPPSGNSPLEARRLHDANFYFDANFILGDRELNRDWDPVQNQSQIGIQLTMAPRRWSTGLGNDSIGIAADLFSSGASKEVVDPSNGQRVRFDSGVAEIALGVRLAADNDVFRPFVGAGVSSVAASFSGTQNGQTISDSGSGAGGWLQAGINMRLGRHFNLGAQWRYSSATVTVFDVTTNAGGSQFGLVLGGGFGSAARAPR